MFGELLAMSRDQAHLFIHAGMVAPFAAFSTNPGRNVLDNNERLAVPEVFAFPPCFQTSFTTADAHLTCQISDFFTFHKLSQ